MNQGNPIFGLIQSLLVIILAFIFVYKYADIRTKTTHFVCPICRSSFKLSKLSFAIALKTGIMNERIVTCPVCGYKGKMPIVKD
jgi:DNA-directed RNA polymerase subunit RPC12/RpoP